VIEDYSEESFKPFFKDKIAIESTIFTDLCNSNKPLSAKYNIQREKSKKGESMKLLRSHIINMKSWLRGIHHHISSKHAQSYMDGYHFKFNRRLNLENCFEKLINKMSLKAWFSYKMATDDLSV
jgi:transposase-like protein